MFLGFWSLNFLKASIVVILGMSIIVQKFGIKGFVVVVVVVHNSTK
jgi:hypothetical protein